MSLTERRTFAEEIARVAGAIIVDLRERNAVEVSYKDPINLVTTADLAAERSIIDAIRARFPGDRILSEEASPSFADARWYRDPLWIIDPVDGTTNYAHGHHHVGVSIAFALAGEAQVGVVFAPFLNELFSAARGAGATLNGKPIRCSATSDMGKALIATGTPYHKRAIIDQIMAQYRAVLMECRDFRRNGAASLDCCAVAAGRVDAYFETVAPWDIAAGGLIASEAGARRGHFAPPPASSVLPRELEGHEFLVATPSIFQSLSDLLVRGG